MREVVALFNSYPDVSVIYATLNARRCLIELRCSRMAVLSRLAVWVMEGANQRVSILSRGPRAAKSGGRFRATDIHFLIDVDRFPRKGERHTPLEILGIFLVWDLKALKRITVARAKVLLQKWHGTMR
jgi:hypothetical protein